MDDTEKLVKRFLASLGHARAVYEPDGNVPPDFLIDGRIAVEARRLNQSVNLGGKNLELEDVAHSVPAGIRALLPTFGSPVDGASWFVFLRFRRPLPQIRIIQRAVAAILTTVARERPAHEAMEFVVLENLKLELRRATKPFSQLFVLGGWIDADSGGWVLYEIGKNLQRCIDEKTQKVAPYRSKYPVWWLVFADHIGCGLNREDQELFRDQISVSHSFDRVYLIDPRNPTRYFQL